MLDQHKRSSTLDLKHGFAIKIPHTASEVKILKLIGPKTKSQSNLQHIRSTEKRKGVSKKKQLNFIVQIEEFDFEWVSQSIYFLPSHFKVAKPFLLSGLFPLLNES
jgi:hypothetical protein